VIDTEDAAARRREAVQVLLEPGEVPREAGEVRVAFGDEGPVAQWQPLELETPRWLERIWAWGTRSTPRKVVFFTLLAPLAACAALSSIGPPDVADRLIGGRTCEGPRDSLARRVQHWLNALGPAADGIVVSDRRMLVVRGMLFTDAPALILVGSVPLDEIAAAHPSPRGPARRRVEVRFTDGSRIVLALPVLRAPAPERLAIALRSGGHGAGAAGLEEFSP
jgi:hypothetical protein